jgi:hypothetical protein
MERKVIGRRRFLALTGGGLSVLAVGAACGDGDSGSRRTGAAALATPTRKASDDEKQGEKGTVLVGDVLDHALSDSRWSGDYGFVTMKLHEGLVDGERAYFIRTDASDEAFAEKERLVFVPLMAKALAGGRGVADIFLFTNGEQGQPAVLSTAPNKPDYTPAFVVNRVTFTGQPERLDSVSAVRSAESAGRIRLERTNIVVNYPVVKWPGGEMPVDNDRTGYLGDGQLIEPVDVEGGTVTFKLHACYPDARYIVTDVTVAPMAEMMNIAPAPAAAPLTDAGATAKILVFGNGLEGSGPMGFQKSVMDSSAGDQNWSPFWDHFTFTWNDGSQATLLKTESALLRAESAGQLRRHPGVPDGELFMVNCPVPVAAPVA